MRPIIDLPLTPMDWLLELAAIGGLLFAIVILNLRWAAIPPRVAMHFGATGQPDQWGSKKNFVTLPVAAALLYGALTLLGLSPHRLNYPWAITPENAERLYSLMTLMLRLLKLEIVWLLALIEWKAIKVALGKAEGLGCALPLAGLLVPALTIGIYIVLASRAAR